MELIDFDSRFADYLNDWVEKNRERFKRPEDMEEEMPGVYLQFLNAPADWLGGATPGDYFDRYTDGAELCALLSRYAEEDVPVPDPLLDRLLDIGDEDALMTLIKEPTAPLSARMHGVALLRQLESEAPMVEYIRWQVERDQPEDLLENALESLKDMGKGAFKAVRFAFSAADEAGKEALLDVLSDFPTDDEVFSFALQCFENSKERQGLFAGYLAKLGDDRALEALLNAAESDTTDYVDFIEIRSAIERLGSEAPIRDFSKDPTYKAMRQLQ